MIQKINLGVVTNDRKGDGAKTAGQKINANFEFLEAKINNVDKLVKETGFTLAGQNLTMNTGYECLINGTTYTNPADVVMVIPFAPAGNKILYLVVMNTSNTFSLVAGPASASNPVAPILPDNTVQVTLILVTDSVVGTPTTPIVGDNYISKIEKTYKTLTGTGIVTVVEDLSDTYNSALLINGSITQINTIGYGNSMYLYPNKKLIIKNIQTTDVIIKHNSSSLGSYKFSFPNAQDFILKQNEVIEFVLQFSDTNAGKFNYVGVVYDKVRLGLGNVNNTSDANKPISTAAQAALDLKLDASAYNDRFKGVYLTLSALNSAHPTANVGDYAQVNEVGATDVLNYNWDAEENIWVPNVVAGSGATNTDQLPEGTSNLYFNTARVLATLLTGISFVTGGAIVSTDSVLAAMGKLQKQISNNITALSGKQNTLVAGTNVTIDNTNPLAPVISASGGGGSGVNVIRGSNNNMAILATEMVASYGSAGGNWVIPAVAVTKSGSLITGPALEIQSERVAVTSIISSIQIKYFLEDSGGGQIHRLYAFKVNDGANTIYDVRLIFEKTLTGTLYRIVNKTYLTADMNDANMIEGEQICYTIQASSGTATRAKGFNILIKH